ncbi:MAG: ATP-binding protein [Planctomycetota bacterium]
MSESPAAPTLTPTQQAALAKIACGISQPGGVALLCGPQGVGKTTVLTHLASARQLRSLSVEVRDIAAWATAAEACRRDLPDVVVADDAHLAADGDIARLLATCRNRRPAASVVLAGEGRLLTLVSRDSRVEQAIHLRASLRPCTLAESFGMIITALGTTVVDDALHPALATIHEIAAGIPAAMLRLASLAAVLAASRPDLPINPADIETIHRRLSPQAA